MNKALHGGPWFINGFFLSIRRCQPNFVASSAKETVTAIWLRLPELPTQYYDHKRLYMKGTVSCGGVSMHGPHLLDMQIFPEKETRGELKGFKRRGIQHS
ncbi:hypothetical protein KY290_010209 [Solanum tuberosum]|uniref:DUF4283 domain-containing protein n=1 Tax=Solanum tuberosum TaxID=4113 RepID=A0ABQ7VZU8_SOLTU|nr:hypothetical protein KY289_010594 [Solanum tuberosum]KAH0773072.1 hypothetical protein KY290_010209 [Solanum tuberosum]